MPKRARRLPVRSLICSARRALLAFCAWTGLLCGAVAPGAATPAQAVLAAEYQEPTTRYNHAVLGDSAEWGALHLRVETCPGCANPQRRDIVLRLPESRVFEDIAPRLIDLDFDGAREVLVVESDIALGARLAIYDASGLITATPFIGRAHRWLAPLGAADLDGDGRMELAYIDRPHLAKTLRVWRYEDRKLTEVAALLGLTNHRIGQAFISGGIRDCGEGPEIITVDANWANVMATRLQDGTLSTRKIAQFTGPKALPLALDCR